jgi:hypothetical protein
MFQNKKRKFLPRVLHSGKSKKKGDGANGVKSSPRGRMALGEGFPECTIFGSRGRPISRERHPRRLFPECCTRGRLPRVFWGLRTATSLPYARSTFDGRPTNDAWRREGHRSLGSLAGSVTTRQLAERLSQDCRFIYIKRAETFLKNTRMV